MIFARSRQAFGPRRTSMSASVHRTRRRMPDRKRRYSKRGVRDAFTMQSARISPRRPLRARGPRCHRNWAIGTTRENAIGGNAFKGERIRGFFGAKRSPTMGGNTPYAGHRWTGLRDAFSMPPGVDAQSIP